MEGHVTCIQHAEVAGVEPMPIHILPQWLYHRAVKMRLCLSMGAAAAGAPGGAKRHVLVPARQCEWLGSIELSGWNSVV